MKVVSVIAVVTAIVVVFVLIAPVVDLSPAARLVRASQALLSLTALLPMAFPRNAIATGSRQLERSRAPAEGSPRVVPLAALDCVLLC